MESRNWSQLAVKKDGESHMRGLTTYKLSIYIKVYEHSSLTGGPEKTIQLYAASRVTV